MSAPTTNTVHVALQDRDLAETRQVLEQFGEVAAARLLGGTPPQAAVVFFDVRSAARAMELLGPDLCTAGPLEGDHTTRLSGDAPFDSEDHALVMAIHEDGDGGFVFEFFDSREAARYRGAGGQAASAGGDEGSPHEGDVGGGGAHEHEAEPPESADGGQHWASAATPWPLLYVLVRGLPNQLLGERAMGVIIQQARLVDAVGCSMRMGQAGCSFGDALIGFSSRYGACHCLAHFRGCTWDKSGVFVTTMLVCPPGGPSSLDWHVAPGGALAPAGGWADAAPPAPAALPVPAALPPPAGAGGFQQLPARGVSASKAKVQGPVLGASSGAVKARQTAGAGKPRKLAASDESTEAGESEFDREEAMLLAYGK